MADIDLETAVDSGGVRCRIGWWKAAILLPVLMAITLTEMLMICESTLDVEVQTLSH